jgi:hypothetical protein
MDGVTRKHARRSQRKESNKTHSVTEDNKTFDMSNDGIHLIDSHSLFGDHLIEFSKVGRMVALELCGDANGEILAPPPLPRKGDGDMAGEPGRT